MSPEENKAVVRRFYEEIDRGNLAAMDELVAEDYSDHNPALPGLAAGREGLKQAFQVFLEAAPGYHEIHDMIAADDRVVTRLTAHGRHERDLLGIPATGRPLVMPAIAIHRLEDGKIVEHWSARDNLGFLQQLGVIPVPSQAEGRQG